jgi:hypothetical protein
MTRDNILRVLVLVAFLVAMLMSARANSRLMAKRDRSRSLFSPMHTIDALKTREAYVLLAWVLIVIGLAGLLVSIWPQIK